MIALFGCITLLLLSMLVASLRPIYSATTEKELDRRVRKGDRSSVAMHQVSIYGSSVDAALSSFVALLSATSFVIIVTQTHVVIAALIIAISTIVLFYVLPRHRFKFAQKLAIALSPYLSSSLKKMRPILRTSQVKQTSNDLYEKDDLLELLQNQKSVPSNRIEAAELDLARHVLTFGDKKVSNYMIPRKKVHMVSSEEPVGPILLSELHDSGFTYFPVLNKKDDTIVGTLLLKDLVEKRATGVVSNVMSPAVYYVNFDASLEQVLDAFTKTKHHMFIVVNDAVEIVGAITIQAVLEQVTGQKIVDEFNDYDNIHHVATHKTSKKKQ